MKKKMIFNAILVILCLTACSKEDTTMPDPTGFDNNQELPLFDYDRTKDFAFWPTPTIDDSELQGEGYDFAYWNQHKAEAENMAEMMAMCNVPKELLANMSTYNLAVTCFNYPYNGAFLTASSDTYKAFQYYVSCFNGYAELMKRYGGLQATLDVYEESPQYTSSFSTVYSWAWTLFVCTAVDHKMLSREQVARLSQVVTSRIADSEVDSMNLIYNYLLGGFIAYHYDLTLPDEQLYLLKSYIQFYSDHPFGKPIDRISNIIDASLQRLAVGVPED